MQRSGLRSKIYASVGAVGWISGSVGIILAACSKADPSHIPREWAGLAVIVAWLKNWSPVLAPALGGVAGVCALLRKQIGEPWVWSAIHEFLNNYRDYVFAAEASDPKDHHRVTLFRHVKWYQWPCIIRRTLDSHLMPVERSGHMTQRSDTVFRAPDDPSRTQGVAGQTWRVFQTVTINELPDLHADGSQANINEYARRTWNKPEWVRMRLQKNKQLARSFCGIPIRVKGKEWGLIIIDSRSSTAIQRNSNGVYDLMGRTLGKLLERI